MDAWAATLADLPDHAARVAATDRVLLARLFASSLPPHASRVLATATAACTLMYHTGEMPHLQAGREIGRSRLEEVWRRLDPARR
jgi:hypothetical protein